MCWQSILKFAREYPAVFTAMAFVLFWFLRFAVGHKMYRLICWRLPEHQDSWWKGIDLHDWQLFIETQKSFGDLEAKSTTRCSRCLSSRMRLANGEFAYSWQV